MNKIDIENIKKMTNNLVAYENFERRIFMKRKKIKTMIFTLLVLGIVTGGAITVDAMTDNVISDTIKDVLKVKVNNEDYNAKCEKTKDGNIKCTVDEEVANGSEFVIETSEDNLDKIDFEITENESTISINEELKPMN